MWLQPIKTIILKTMVNMNRTSHLKSTGNRCVSQLFKINEYLSSYLHLSAYTVTQSHTLTRIFMHSHVLTYSHTLNHSHALIHAQTHVVTHTDTQSHIHSSVHTLTHMYVQVLTHTLSHIHTHYVGANTKNTRHYTEWKKENDEYLFGFNFLNLR